MPVSAFPVRVVPLGGETPEGYVSRLATANAVPVGQLAKAWQLPDDAAPRAAALEHAAERAGGLAHGHFDRDRRRHLLYVTCHHQRWSARHPCRKCDIVDWPRSGCRGCTAGTPTTIISRGGAVCTRHRRWRHQGLNIDLSRLRTYSRAERSMSGSLWSRGVTVHTKETLLATGLTVAAHEHAGSTLRRDRLTALGVDDELSASSLLTYYPEIVAVACVLTDRAVASALCTHRMTVSQQTQMLIGLVVGASGGEATDALVEIARDEVVRTRVALQDAFSTPSSPGATVRRAPRPKAMIEAAYRHGAVLLRHADEVRVYAPPVPGVRATPKSKIVSRRVLSDFGSARRRAGAAPPNMRHDVHR